MIKGENIMTQTNINTMDLIIDKMAEFKSLSRALRHVYKKRKVAIPFDDNTFDVEVLKLDIHSRASNALMRSGLKTLNDVIEYAEDNHLGKVKNLGKVSAIEVMETMLDIAWSKMNEDEKVAFLIDIVERNEKNIRPEVM
jgi:DNA-directed RNA polymerase alpha subunit